MGNMNAVKNLTHPRIPARWVLNHIPAGKRLRLRDGVYRQIKEREWILKKIDREGVHLLHESRAYGFIVKMEDIDWSEFQGELGEGNRGPFSQGKQLES